MNESSIFAAIRGEFGVYSIQDLMNTKEYKELGYKIVECPVCGCKTLDMNWICSGCGWEYDGSDDDHYSSANDATLREYRKLYNETLDLVKKKEGG